MKRLAILVCAAIVMALAIPAVHRQLQGADHRDAPLQLNNPRLDLNDVYVFRSPQDANNVVLTATVHPAFTAGAGALFDHNGIYEFLVSNDGDLIADIVVSVTFTNDVPQQFSIQGLTSVPLTGTVTEPGMADQISQDGAVTAFCGVKDDPFFFDLDGFQAFIAGPYIPDQGGLRGSTGLPGPPQNFFGTLNVAAIVIECPVTQLTGGVDPNSGSIQVWAKTFGT